MIFLAKNLKFKRKKLGFSQSDLAKRAGVLATTISNYENEVSTPDYKVLYDISKILGVSPSDLIYTDLEKETLKTTPNTTPNTTPKVDKDLISGKNLRVLSVAVTNAQRENIVFVPVKAHAGYLLGFADPEYIKDLPSFSLIGFTNGTFRAFEVQGDSMEPGIIEHDIVIGKSVDNWYELKDNNIYILITTDGIVIKRIINRLKEDVVLILISDNAFYKPNTVSAQNIKEVWEYRGLIRTRFKEHYGRRLEDRVLDIEKKLNELKLGDINKKKD